MTGIERLHEVVGGLGLTALAGRLESLLEQVSKLQHDANNALTLTWQMVAFSVVEVAETAVAVECLPMYHTSNGILTTVAKTTVDGICQ